MLNIEKSSLILILIIVVLIAGFVSLVTLGYTPGSVWHKAEDIKPGEVGKSVGATATSTYLFPNLEAKSQVTAGTKFHVGSSDLSSSELKVNNNSLVVTTTGNVGVGTTNPGSYKLNVNGSINASNFYKNGVEFSGGACQISGNDIVCSGIPTNTSGSLSITKNGVTCPIWKDCDGDGHTYGNGDCDESCPTCYVGSTHYTDSPDGRDKNCNGIVDEYKPPQTLSCPPVFPLLQTPGPSCNQAADDAYCTSVCENNGWGKGTTTCFNAWGCDEWDGIGYCYGASFCQDDVASNNGNHRVTCRCASGYR